MPLRTRPCDLRLLLRTYSSLSTRYWNVGSWKHMCEMKGLAKSAPPVSGRVPIIDPPRANEVQAPDDGLF
jgi:hypothetical protein